LEDKHILVFTQYYYPEEFRINDICEQWVKRGYKVTAVTGIPNYPYGKFFNGYGIFKKRHEIYNGVEIIRLPIISRGKSSLRISLNYLSFVFSGALWALFSNKDADIVFNYECSPMTQSLPAVWFSKKNHVSCYIYIMDLWPDSVKAVSKFSNVLFIKLLQIMCDYIYINSDKIFTSSKSFIEEIKKRGITTDKLIFWPQFAEKFYKPLIKEEVDVKEIPNDNKFNIVFAGNIGYAQGLEILPDVAKLIKENNSQIRFCIIGDGRFKEKLIKLITEKDVNDVFLFIDHQPATRIPEFMAVCDAALIILKKNELFAKTIPAKVQSCMACGIPIILSADGEAQEVIEKAQCGVYCEAGNAQKLYNNIIKLSNLTNESLDEIGNNAINFYNENYECEMLLNKMDKYFNIK